MKQPTLVRGERPGEYWAHFASGAAVQLHASRTRRYPGVRSHAPDTSAIYSTIGQSLPPTARVLDVGTGAGVGALVLASRSERVVGVDIDGAALAFAREWAPRASFVRGDAALGSVLPDADVAVLVDVLGHVVDPVAVMRNVRRQLRASSFVWIAEPLAHPTQQLSAPARRAFSRGELQQLLSISGLVAKRWFGEGSGFVACVAGCREGNAYEVVEAGDRACQRGLHEVAEGHFEQARRSGDAALACEAELRLGTLFEELGMFAEASACYFELKGKAPEDPRAMALLARLQARLGRGYEALELARSAVELDPASRVAVTCLATVAEALEHRDTVSAWRMAHALAPDNEAVGAALARHLTEAGEREQASEILARVGQYARPQS